MKYFTQTELAHGNCWQTAIACILDVDPELLPPQPEIEQLPLEVLNGWGSYHNALNGYLVKHHGLIYSEVHQPMMGAVRPVRAEHLLIGPTVRTAAHASAGRRHIHHCVVGRDGAMIWDPHPSRAGLLEVDSWGVLGPVHKGFQERVTSRSDEAHRLVLSCICPSCGLAAVRARRAEVDAAAAAKAAQQ